MNKKILIGGTLAIIFVLASFSSVASAQTTPLNKNILKTNLVNLKNLLENKKSSLSSDWYPGVLIGFIINLFIDFYIWLVINHQ